MTFTYYIDYGSGFVQINPYNNSLNLGIRREMNPFIYRKFVEGTFTLIGSEAITANTYFITGGNYEAPFRIYQDGTISTGVLKYEGWTKILGEYDYQTNTITFNSFRTNDQYSKLIPYLSASETGEQFGYSGIGINDFLLQGNNGNSNKIQAYTWSGTAWTVTGNTLALGNIGRVQVTAQGTGIAVFDNYTKDLRRYTYTAPDFALATIGQSLIMNQLTGNGAIVGYTANQIVFVDDWFHELRIYQSASTAPYWTLVSQKTIYSIKHPSLAFMATNYVALVDEGTKTLSAFNNLNQVGDSFSLGDITKPQICSLDSANFNIAMVDSKTQTLRAFNFNAGVWSQIGTPISIGVVNEPTVTFEATNTVNVYDSSNGNLSRYTYSGGTWTQSGSSISIGGGYSAGIAYIGTSSVLAFIQSDGYNFFSWQSWVYRECFNNISYLNGALTDGYAMNPTGVGATFDIEKVAIGSLPTVSELNEADRLLANYNKSQYSFNTLFNIAELFQNYWYCVYDNTEPEGDYPIRFIQPILFSSIGTDIDVSSKAVNLNRRTYQSQFEISKEEISLPNLDTSNVIDYGRNTPIIEQYAFDYTTNLFFMREDFLRLDFDFKKDGLFLFYVDTDSFGYYVDDNNSTLSLSQIVNDFWLDYRYANSGTIEINGSPSAVQDTVRPMIGFPTVEFKQSDVGITEFPDDIASLDWGGGVKSYITMLKLNLNTFIYSVESILLDL